MDEAPVAEDHVPAMQGVGGAVGDDEQYDPAGQMMGTPLEQE